MLLYVKVQNISIDLLQGVVGVLVVLDPVADLEQKVEDLEEGALVIQRQ